MAEHGIGAALSALVPGTRLHEGVWEFEGPSERDIKLRGRGVVLLPTFHWTGIPSSPTCPMAPWS
ncbi:hypothetical protein ACH492_10955 [Streptomyces sp. NPDC019443]|uniref:hypothetical protein n=1 Tax=Streptomyces sp. NPDC019443 TaxID=3365061 RepID=UPI00378BA17E